MFLRISRRDVLFHNLSASRVISLYTYALICFYTYIHICIFIYKYLFQDNSWIRIIIIFCFTIYSDVVFRLFLWTSNGSLILGSYRRRRFPVPGTLARTRRVCVNSIRGPPPWCSTVNWLLTASGIFCQINKSRLSETLLTVQIDLSRWQKRLIGEYLQLSFVWICLYLPSTSDCLLGGVHLADFFFCVSSFRCISASPVTLLTSQDLFPEVPGQSKRTHLRQGCYLGCNSTRTNLPVEANIPSTASLREQQ